MVKREITVELPFEWCVYCNKMNVQNCNEQHDWYDLYDNVVRADYKSLFSCKNETFCTETNRARIKSLSQNEQVIE